ncbi:MAG TPA: hypothetical protein VLR26_09090 [Frankiaceae bacterium]|nr:hypothetical protein [Frankiaceae bacterium]
MTRPLEPAGRLPNRQLSLLAGDVAPAGVADLEGLLCGTSHVVRGSGALADTARVSVLVDDAWRVTALEARLDELNLLAPNRPSASAARPHAVSVRTRFDPRLFPLVDRWTRGATLVAPQTLHLDGHRLWWWAVSAGVADGLGSRGGGGRGFRFRLAPSAPRRWAVAGAALAELGVPGIFLGPRADGPAYRLVGSRRLARLADLVGEPPPGAPASSWPTATRPPGQPGIGRVRHLPEPSAAGDDADPVGS